MRRLVEIRHHNIEVKGFFSRQMTLVPDTLDYINPEYVTAVEQKEAYGKKYTKIHLIDDRYVIAAEPATDIVRKIQNAR